MVGQVVPLNPAASGRGPAHSVRKGKMPVLVDKTPYVRFDLNDYSVPHTHVRRTLTVLADTHELRIVNGAQVIACHHRSYDHGEQIEQAEHLQALIDQKRGARQHRATDRLAQVAPARRDLLMRAAERGANLGASTHGLMRLLDRYGAADLQAATRKHAAAAAALRDMLKASMHLSY